MSYNTIMHLNPAASIVAKVSEITYNELRITDHIHSHRINTMIKFKRRHRVGSQGYQRSRIGNLLRNFYVEIWPLTVILNAIA